MSNCAVVIPVYKAEFDAEEYFAVSHSVKHLEGYDIHWLVPQSLNMDYYFKNFNIQYVQRFDDAYFQNIEGYNRLLVSIEFYERFKEYEYTLISQPDAIIIKPELHLWLEKKFDYIGAPWPSGYSLKVKTKSIPMAEEITCTAFIGNGGLSLRRNQACVDLLNEFEDLQKEWSKHGHAEDLFFSLIGSISVKYQLPNIIQAALFSHDVEIRYVNKLIGGVKPFGIHAWNKYDRELSMELINQSGD